MVVTYRDTGFTIIAQPYHACFTRCYRVAICWLVWIRCEIISIVVFERLAKTQRHILMMPTVKLQVVNKMTYLYCKLELTNNDHVK